MTRMPDVVRSRPAGLIPVMLLPFTPEGRIDDPALDALIDFYLQNGAVGLFANCLSSEMYALSPAERLGHVRHVVRRVGGQVPVVASGTFGGPVAEQAVFVQQMHEQGVNSVILITCQLAAADEPDRTLLNRLDDLLDQTGTIPLGLYECPVPYKRLLSPALLAQVVATGRFNYHKDTSCDPVAVAQKLAVVPRDAFGFYDAHLPNATSSLRAGASGLSAIAGNYFPEILTWLCRNVNSDAQQETVAWLQGELTRTNALLHEGYPASAKHFLRLRGLPIGATCRLPLPPLTVAQHGALRELHRTWSGWHERLGLS